jgi:hypothetical protein
MIVAWAPLALLALVCAWLALRLAVRRAGDRRRRSRPMRERWLGPVPGAAIPFHPMSPITPKGRANSGPPAQKGKV